MSACQGSLMVWVRIRHLHSQGASEFGNENKGYPAWCLLQPQLRVSGNAGWMREGHPHPLSPSLILFQLTPLISFPVLFCFFLNFGFISCGAAIEPRDLYMLGKHPPQFCHEQSDFLNFICGAGGEGCGTQGPMHAWQAL